MHRPPPPGLADRHRSMRPRVAAAASVLVLLNAALPTLVHPEQLDRTSPSRPTRGQRCRARVEGGGRSLESGVKFSQMLVRAK